MKKNDFEKYATGHLGINSHTLYDLSLIHIYRLGFGKKLLWHE